MNLTEREKQIFALLKGQKSISMDELVKVFGVSRHALRINIMYLHNKISPEGWVITNSGSVGRGNKSVYTMEKRK